MLDESKVDKYLARIVSREGGQSLKFVSPGMAGVPDRIVILPGGVLWFVELKAPHKKPRALQRFVMRRLRKLGCQVVIIDNKKTVKAFVGLRVRRRDHAVCPTQVSTERN